MIYIFNLVKYYGFWFSKKLKIKACNSTRKIDIYGKEMAISRPDFYADHDGTNGFWKFWDLDQNNPL